MSSAHAGAGAQDAAQVLSWLSCRASDNTWWIVMAALPVLPIYLNNRKLGAGEAAQVFTGDVLTFSAADGSGMRAAFENYFARFEIDISIRAYNAVQHTIIG